MLKPAPLPPLPLSSFQKWGLIIGLPVFAGLIVLSGLATAHTPQIAAVRAVRKAVGGHTGPIRTSAPYAFEDVDGASSPRTKLVCGAIGDGSVRRFAALVRRYGRGRPTTYRHVSGPYFVVELAIDPPRGRPPLVREAQLLGACSSSDVPARRF